MNQHTVVLTGATGGIGSAIANALCQSGASLVLVGRSKDKLEKLKSELQENFPQANLFAKSCELSNQESRSQLLDFIEGLPIQVDMLINNAGVNQFGFLSDQPEDVIANQIQINAIYPLLLSRQFLKYFEKRSIAGQIVNIGSTFGNIAYPGFCAYSASKFALRGASEALAREYADTNIRVRYFAPRATQTSLNSDNVVTMNRELKVAMDSPAKVASELIAFINTKKRVRYLGWPEKLFVFINQLAPSLVSKSLQKNLPVIRRYARKA